MFKELFIESKYAVYHDTYTNAIEAAKMFTKKQGYDLDDDELANEIGFGPGKPKKGKTVRHTLTLFKNGKPIKGKKRLQIQVYNRDTDSNTYELNTYIA